MVDAPAGLFAISICGLVLSIRGRRQGSLPIFGIVMSALARLIRFIGAFVIFRMM